VVNANQEIDLERFVKDLSKGNKFKFIERTAGIENGPRGIKVDDGLIRVSFKYEKVYPMFTNAILRGNTYNTYSNPSQWVGGASGSLGGMQFDNNVTCSATGGWTQGAVDKAAFINQTSVTSKGFAQAQSAQLSAKPQSEVGITVPGSLSEQKFTTVSNFQTEAEEHVMVLRLAGDLGQNPVTKPVTVKAKPKCVTCGRTNKATSKFCVDCGTSLQIV
jgi:hypothetical protein